MTLAVLVGGPQNGEYVEVRDCPFVLKVAVRSLPFFAQPSSHYEPTYEVETYELWTRDRTFDCAVYLWHEDRKLMRVGMPEPAPIRPDGAWRWCKKCDVKWWGSPLCWNCGQQVEGHPFYPRF